jgi:hypothetical protein
LFLLQTEVGYRRFALFLVFFFCFCFSSFCGLKADLRDALEKGFAKDEDTESLQRELDLSMELLKQARSKTCHFRALR